MDTNMLRLQLYSILKFDWSGAWLLLPIVTRTVNSIVSAGYSRKIVLMRVKWNLFSKSCSFRRLTVCSSVAIFVSSCSQDSAVTTKKVLTD